MKIVLTLALVSWIVSCKNNDSFINYQKVEIAGDLVETLEDQSVVFTPPSKSDNESLVKRLTYQAVCFSN